MYLEGKVIKFLPETCSGIIEWEEKLKDNQGSIKRAAVFYIEGFSVPRLRNGAGGKTEIFLGRTPFDFEIEGCSPEIIEESENQEICYPPVVFCLEHQNPEESDMSINIVAFWSYKEEYDEFKEMIENHFGISL